MNLKSLGVLGVLAAVSCSKGDASTASRTRPPPLVAVGRVQARDVPVVVRAPVELRPLAQADVGSKTLGILDAVLVDRGDRVKRAQLVALVRPSDLPDQLAAARSTLSQTEASLSLARTNYDRAHELAPSGVVSQAELQTSTAALAQAEAQNAAARSQVGALAVRLGETRIESPMDGYVSARRLDPGAIVGPPGGGAIVTIVRIDTLRVFVTVPEHDVGSVRVGQDAHVEIDAQPGKSIQGKVVRVSPTIDPSTRTLDAEVQLPNHGELLRPGMFGHGSIVVGVHAHSPVVPASAMQITDGKPFVFVLVPTNAGSPPGGERVQRRAIETGVDGGTWIEVTRGLSDGDDIVTAGIDVLSDGAQVRVARDVDPYSGTSATAPAAPTVQHD